MIHPRRLKGTPGNIAKYYSVGDYYTKGADEHSQWGGAIAGDLGLEGRVDPEVFRELLAGRVAGRQLGRHRADGQIQHHPGWDFSVNAPKSVSIMALVADDDRILAAHEHAVGVALDYLEEHAALRRRDDGAIVQETTGRLIFARFTEHASRELDPHLHTHVVVMNMTNHEPDVPMASLETRTMYGEQMTAGQAYRNELARDLRDLGYEIESDPRTGLFEIKGVPADLIKAFSQRAEQIDAHAKEHGLTGQAARRKAFYKTRPPKATLGLDALHGQWRNRSQKKWLKIDELRSNAASLTDREADIAPFAPARATLFGIKQAETGEAVNNLGRLIRLGLASHVGEVRLGEIRPLLEHRENRGSLLRVDELTGDHAHTRGRSTRRTAQMERTLSWHLALALDDGRPIASADRLLHVLEVSDLTPAQEQALAHAALSRDRVTAIHGVAGSGKSTLIHALKRAVDPNVTLLALAPTSSAAANLGDTAGIDSRTVASLFASGGRNITDQHVLVLDEAGQLGNRQALRLLEISRHTGARLMMLGDEKQTGAIEQGKPFWLLQRLGMSTAHLTESVRQQTRPMRDAVTSARAGNFSASLASLDKVVSGAPAEQLAKSLVSEWTRLTPATRDRTNILVLENATRLVVNAQIRKALKREGAIAAQDTRLDVLTPAGLSSEQKGNARFYSPGQVVTFERDLVGQGIARGTEYRVLSLGRTDNDRHILRLVDSQGQIVRWDPRLGKARQVNVFNPEKRELAAGDRIQWRLANKELGLKNAERGTVELMHGTVAMIRWDREGRVQKIDLAEHKTWDHGFSETVFSSQSKTYDRVYILAPVNSGLVNGQNYYTAITRARFGAKLWTEDEKRLVQRISERSGEKTSVLEGLGRLSRDQALALAGRHSHEILERRQEQERTRADRRSRHSGAERSEPRDSRLGPKLAANARGLAEMLHRFLAGVQERSRPNEGRIDHAAAPRTDRQPDQTHQHSRGIDR